MKTVAFLIFGVLTLSSCNPKSASKATLENSESRNEIYNEIYSNRDYMTEFINKMQTSNQGMQMMQGNQKMMGTMMQGQGMQMMMKDSTMTKQIMSEMMKDGKILGAMMQMMQQNGMMSNDCMQSSTKMMTNKGMKIDNK